MNIKLILFISAFFLMFACIIVFIIDDITSEYKYTAKVKCYDKRGSEIEGLTCHKEIYCGVSANRNDGLPCDKNEYDKLMETKE